ncbi:MAG: 23S rRNA (adenine(2030)-N(6))-methyltransferase RlmJ [Alphaproteobacteria bacterium]|nr:23S rRNA (adenine(2030)-N(6))-methyltransferase RlmJ [Alphaproteobacteria bacterium]MBU1514769.1 23S rRNA (adenine(2030)-N(6))-methyltransferase RlmJ [Alphaproteobacteria bacterium]MBU2093900.1 23S rRNA (adenine(2030)-N(6))-methyltransferase RlmJ [Alphaproteobacteria bacterium]MBU2153327.1 23S rRNA (adenine(2030)-N(6))-methyltransferase RlmJ [Alphaproteobacteria bacterium]MBU2309755.1 23S rRNA (adenine(2030)-N(6))-methyltransferase RlmJ [Alphaproteobacteria bacterium]
MNYRHAFHAGNFADLVKHAALLRLLADLTAKGPPLTVIDTHAGGGLYDLAGVEARKSGEAEAGIVRLMAANDAPAEFASLKAVVAGLMGGGAEVRRYPGSPWLIAGALRTADRYVACELRPDEHEALRIAMRGRQNVRTLNIDGYAAAVAECPREGRVLVLIDPPFEKPDDYDRIVETLAALRRKNAQAQALVWLPVKDLETLDSFLRDLEDEVAAPMLVAETRLKPLTDPMKMNGCALLLMNGPDLGGPLAAICGWVAQALGAGGGARIYALTPQ